MGLGLKEKKVLINGLDINYKIMGEGRVVLILHGWGSSSDSWFDVCEGLSRQSYKVLCPDFPGFGKSQEPPIPWSVGHYVDWLLDFINYFKVKKVILLGHSFGGRVAIKMAVNYKEKIDKLILSSSAGIKLKPGPKAGLIIFLAKFGNLIINNRYLKFFKKSANKFFYFMLKPLASKSDYVKAEGIMKDTMKEVVKEDLRHYLSKIKTKTLLVWGKNDKMVPLKCARIFKKEIKNSQLEIIKGVGHSPHLERPEELVKVIIKFLNQT